MQSSPGERATKLDSAASETDGGRFDNEMVGRDRRGVRRERSKKV